MSLTDRYGLTLSTTSSVAARHYQDGMDRILSYGFGADQAFASAVAADEGFALAHAGAALFSLFQGDGASAKTSIERARSLAAGATRREQQHVGALSAIAGGEAARGLGLIEEHVKEFPRDALLVNQAGSTIGLGGRADREALRVAFVERLAGAYGDDWWYHSALGFTYHEVGRYDESRRLSERSLAQYPGNANASHNIAHVCYETVDNDGGVALLTDWLGGYDRRAPFHCHLAWHLALFELQRGRPERSLAIYEQDIAPSSNPRLAMIDGSALLWRFGLYDYEKGPLPWRPLAELATRVTRPGFIFGDVHAALAYASAGDGAALSALTAGLEALHAKGHPIAGTVALPLVRGVAAYVDGDFAGALTLMESVDSEIHRVGGSHAQWELFEETMVVCLLRLGRLAEAQRLIRRRLGFRRSPRDLAWLERASR
ncbi:MAG TPA: tetratricopeptide repeat protein [Methylomirabilota bacterium]|nr:tetratricopeptide repeat protein [Methylomirabilota bacterium]